MDFRRLQYFLIVAEEGQITKAARRLHMAQPPLSQQLKLLEGELGVKLIERGGSRKIRLTDAGHALRKQAEQILALVDRTVEEVKDIGEGQGGVLSIGVSTSWGTTFLPERIRHFHRLYPGINFQMWDGDTYRIEEYLRSGVIDIGINRKPVDSDTFASFVLPDEPMTAVFASNWDSGGLDDSVSLMELADKPMIIHRRYEVLLEHYRQMGLEPRILCTHSDVRSMLVWASAGLGVAIVNKSLAQWYQKDLIIKEIVEPPLRTRPSAVVWMRKRYLSAAARHFIDILAQENLSSEAPVL